MLCQVWPEQREMRLLRHFGWIPLTLSLWLGLVLVSSSQACADPLRLTFGASVEERYNDNIFWDTEDETDDFVTTVSPEVILGYQTGRSGATLKGQADFYYYAENSELDDVDQYYSAKLSHQWTPRLLTTLDWSYADDNRPDREFAETGLLLDTDRRKKWDGLLAGQYQLDEVSSLGLSYTYLNEKFNDPDRFDLAGHFCGLSYSRNLSRYLSRTTGSIRLQGGLYKYTQDYSNEEPFFLGTITNVVDYEQAIENYSFTLGVGHELTEKLRISFDAGTRYTVSETTTSQSIIYSWDGRSDARDEETDRSWGFVGTLETAYTGETVRISLLANHDLVPASGENGLTERTKVVLSMNKRLTEDLRAYGSAGAFRNRSDRSDVTTDIDEYSLNFTIGLRYAFDANWSIGGVYRLSWLDDREEGNEYSRNIVSLVVNYNWPIWE